MASHPRRTGIFISYRHAEGGAYAGRLYDFLCAQLGRRADLYMDVEKLTLGLDFVDALDAAIARCQVVLVVIDPTWTDVRDEKGNRRLEDDEDFVHREVAHALARPNLRVIPVLVGGATMPTEAQLPDDLRALARREAFDVTPTGWSRDVGALAERIGRPRRRSRRTALVATAVVVVVAGIAAAVIAARESGSGRATGSTTTTTTSTVTTNATVPPVSLTVAAPPPAFLPAWADSMSDPTTSWALPDNDSCTRSLDATGLHIRVLEEDVACSEAAPSGAGLLFASDTSVSVTTHLDEMTGIEPTIDVECRVSATADGRISGYAAQYGRHFVQFLRYDNGVFRRIASSTIEQPILHVGDTNQLQLECYSSPKGLVLAFFIDGDLVGATLDAKPLLFGNVGVRCGTGDGTIAQCTFTNFSVKTAN
jgi:hypothetical protein